MSGEFVHLHVHSQYSMLDGAIRIERLVQSVKDDGMGAVALTDHGNMYGAVQLYKACKGAGIKPILGCEVYFTPDRTKDLKNPHHMVLLASGQDGYKNLVRIVSLGWVRGMIRDQPVIDLEMLSQHRKGVVALTGCMGGWIAQEVLMRGPEAGRRSLGVLKDALEPGNLFVELQDHGFPEQKPLNEILHKLARDNGLETVASNDCHYHEQNDAQAQLALTCIAAGRTFEEMKRIHHGSDQIYLKTTQEMLQRFRHVPEAARNTLKVSEMTAGTASPTKNPMLPSFPLPSGVSEAEHFTRLAQEGLEKRLTEFQARGLTVNRPEYDARLDLECKMIAKMGFSGYFLIVQDFINWGKSNGVPVGPGRGSGAGSLAAYALGITDLDPLPYNLLFERFLNPERVSMPDFDVDFCMAGRDRVIDYVRNMYGSESVGQIATFHLLKSRSVVRDVGRVMGFSPQDAGRVATLVPEPVAGKSVPIPEALEQEPRLKALYKEDPKVHYLLDTATTLEGLTRHAGMHAAGVVISQGPLWDHVPVFCPEEGVYVTQYYKDDVEAAGLVKFDFLGLKTLTVVDIACRLIGRRPDKDGQPFRIDRIPLDDAATYALLQSGETTNVFQLESSGMQGLFKKLKPDCFEDIVAAVALYRPGPLGTGMVDDFVECKHGRKKVEYPHACLEEILAPTYGVIVYQEQVMQAAQKMAGYTLGGADLLRRAMGKKKPEEMEKQKGIFIEGSLKNGHAEADAARVFDLMAYFAGYGFNKSHSAAYALITYQTAYLKTHYPVEFMCATLSADKDKIEKVVRTVAEARTMGITVLPPDINESQIDFSVVYEPTPNIKPRKEGRPVCSGGVVADVEGPKVRFGLGGVKGIGDAALEAIFEARKSEDGSPAPFVDQYDFTARVDLRKLNKGVLEALVQCGAFDRLHQPRKVHRAQAFASIDTSIERGKKLQAEKASGQQDLFGLLSEADKKEMKVERGEFVVVEPWNTRDLLSRERNALGFYVSGHPLDAYLSEVKRFCTSNVAGLSSLPAEARVEIGGLVEGFRERPTKAGGKMAFFTLEDASDRVEVIVRPKFLESSRDVLTSGEPVLISGQVQFEGDRNASAGDDDTEVQLTTKLLLTDVKPLASYFSQKAKAVRVTLELDSLADQALLTLKRTLLGHPGSCPVQLELRTTEFRVHLKGEGLYVAPSDLLMTQLERLFGRKVAELV
ncbi:MAG: DNA polymerase III subunit alpha [Myxococcales bacterium]